MLLHELLLLHRVEASILVLLLLRLVHVAAHAHGLVLLLDHASALAVLEVTLLLIGLDGDVSIDAVKVFLLFRKHGGDKLKVRCLGGRLSNSYY